MPDGGHGAEVYRRHRNAASPPPGGAGGHRSERVTSTPPTKSEQRLYSSAPTVESSANARTFSTPRPAAMSMPRPKPNQAAVPPLPESSVIVEVASVIEENT